MPGRFLSTEAKASDFEVVAEPPAEKGDFGGLGRPALIHPNGEAKAILFDRHGGKIRYYGGGAGVYASKELVLSQIFESFSWGVLDIGAPST